MSAYVLLLFKQLIRFVNGNIRFFFFVRAECRTKGGYANHLAPRHGHGQRPKRQRLAINNSAARRIARSTSCSAALVLGPNKDVTVLSIAVSPDARFAAAKTEVRTMPPW
jgi:hypothetical protein